MIGGLGTAIAEIVADVGLPYRGRPIGNKRYRVAHHWKQRLSFVHE